MLDAAKAQHAFRLLDEAVEQRLIPGAIAMIAHDGEQLECATGWSVFTDTECTPATMDTIYDGASLTKVTVTLPLVLMLVEQGKLRLNDLVSNYLTSFVSSGKSEITIKQLLTHTSGLPPFVDLHSSGWSTQRMWEQIDSLPLGYAPGTQTVYSDIGFMLLGRIAATLFDVPLEQAANQNVFEPLGMKNSQFNPAERMKSRIAATEYRQHLQDYQRGTVHDENALAFGGISGHAGMFSTAADLTRYAQAWLAGSQNKLSAILSRASIAASLTASSVTPPIHSNRGLGWVLKGDPMDVSGDLSSTRTFGHTGFTGTSLLIDPEYDLTIVLLTNRVHFGRDKSIQQLRACFHNAVIAAIR